MNLTQLTCFVALAETNSFAEAAERVHLTQSAVSHALAALEKELRGTLLKRNRKGIETITDLGNRILPHARLLLAQAEAISQEAEIASGRQKGKIRLGWMECASGEVIAGLLQRFQQRYPDIEVVLFEGRGGEIQEWIQQGVVDVGFVTEPFSSALEVTPLHSSELVVALPEQHRLSKQAGVSLSDLAKEALIMPAAGCYLLELAGISSTMARSLIRFHASDSRTILAMAREGLGVALFLSHLVNNDHEGLCIRPFQPSRSLNLAIALPGNQQATPAARLFVETCVEWYAERGLFNLIQAA